VQIVGREERKRKKKKESKLWFCSRRAVATHAPVPLECNQGGGASTDWRAGGVRDALRRRLEMLPGQSHRCFQEYIDIVRASASLYAHEADGPRITSEFPSFFLVAEKTGALLRATQVRRMGTGRMG
jgi:hypothetical protein